MMKARRWFIELVVVEGHAQMMFGTTSLPGGTVTWDHMPWPIDAVQLTEHQLLSELHDAALQFMERRL